MTSELTTLPVIGAPEGEMLTDAPPAPLGGAAAGGGAPEHRTPINPLAISSAFWASPADATVPIRITDRQLS